MRVFIIGSGGREHALAWKLAHEAEVHACPGNPGISEVATLHEGSVGDFDRLSEICREIQPDLVIVGPEDPLIDGLADRLRSEGVAVLGPNADGARLEGSKAFSKVLMREAGVKTAEFEVFQDHHQASDFVRMRFASGKQVAVKASGAALGKGVIVCGTEEEALDAVQRSMVSLEFGDAGREVVIEDRIVGREFSLLTVVSGRHFLSLPVAQDYKRIKEGDQGPNTGGMGTFSPVDWMTPGLTEQAEEHVVRPIVDLMAEKGIDFRGVLFSGLMVERGTTYCLEYNVRFGDPETQTVVRRIGGGFGRLLQCAANGEPLPPVALNSNHVVTIVLASEGYPGSYEKGRPISMGLLPEGAVVFHAGTKLDGDQLVTAGGRVMAVSAEGKNKEEARKIAYHAADVVDFEGKQYRRDIALS